jgi:DNA uptake protein ComE-like DNA-binding protein
MSSLNQANQSAELFIQGCGYRIENDRVMISIECIGNNRAEDNTSGTLRIQLCAFSSSANEFDNNILASTTIGEIKGQHFIPNCHYDLVFQPPSTGSWQLALQLSEWDGVDYALCDTVYFESPYQTFANSDNREIIESPSNTKTDITLSNQQINQPDALKQDTAPKITINASEQYLVINKLKAKKLLTINGIPKKVLERLVAERPFQSEKAILSVKGMGPVMLKKLLAILAD